MADATRRCEFCGDEMTPMKRPGNPKRFCSPRCQHRARAADPERRERRNEQARQRARRRAADREASLPPKPKCKNCGAELATRSPRAKFCNAPVCQGAMKAEGRRRNPPCSVDNCNRPTLARGYCGSHYKSEYHVPSFGASKRKPKSRTCPCGEVVWSKQAKVKYCSDVCRGAWLGKEPSECTEVIRWRAPREVPEHESRGPRRWTAGACAHCGETFACVGVGAAYCSETCAKRAAWARVYQRRGKFFVLPKVRLSIYERDGWTCQLCGEETSRVYSPADPKSPTLDHIVPRSLQLIPDDSPSNLRLACALCNALRGNDLHWTPEAVAS